MVASTDIFFLNIFNAVGRIHSCGMLGYKRPTTHHCLSIQKREIGQTMSIGRPTHGLSVQCAHMKVFWSKPIFKWSYFHWENQYSKWNYFMEFSFVLHFCSSWLVLHYLLANYTSSYLATWLYPFRLIWLHDALEWIAHCLVKVKIGLKSGQICCLSQAAQTFWIHTVIKQAVTQAEQILWSGPVRFPYSYDEHTVYIYWKKMIALVLLFSKLYLWWNWWRTKYKK
jgi:hypothetical protein